MSGSSLSPAAVLVAGVAAAVTFVGTSAASAATTTTTDPVSAAAGWLASQFAGSSGLPQPGGDHFVADEFQGVIYPNYGENADAIFGLAAAKSGGDAVSRAIAYLKTNVDAYSDASNSDGFGPYDGAVAKTALAAIVGGADATSFGGFNLLKTLKDDECAAASTTCTPGSAANIFAGVSESFVILAEARGGATYAPSTDAINYFLSLQCSDGGFTSGTTACGSGTADLDSTSYAIMALQAAGGQSTALGKAVTWLEGQQNSAGYWVSQGAANTNSTGLAAAALAGQGVNETKARTWLRSQQISAGHAGAGALKYAGSFTATTKTGTSPSVLATAQGLTGLVDGGTLATVTSTGATSGTSAFAPTLTGKASIQAGGSFTATGNGFAAGEKVSAVLHSTPIGEGTVTATAGGTVIVKVSVPASLAAGAHSLLLTGASSGLTAQLNLTVSAAPSSGSTGPILADTGVNQQRMNDWAGYGAAAVALGAGLLFVGRRRASGRHSQ